MKRLSLPISSVALGVALLSSPAWAHFNLISPPPADTATDGGKGAPPCGPTTASNMVTPVTGGTDLEISLSETVLHPGHYRIALAPTRDLLPADPEVVTDSSNRSVSATIDASDPPVLADDLFEHTTGATPIAWKMSVPLPNINCEKCTLQVIEFMAEHGANPGGGYYYHHCADLKITADTTKALDSWPGMPAPTGTAMMPVSTTTSPSTTTPSTTTPSTTTPSTTTASMTKDDGGCALAPGGRSSSAGAAALLALSLGWLARRRR